MNVTLEQMLNAREARAEHQFALSRKYGRPVLSFTMNIPGPVKDTPLIRRGFQAGLTALAQNLHQSLILEKQIIREVTGCEAVFAVDADPIALKRITTRIEDTHPLGRLFDMDVLDENLRKLDRDAVDGGDRGCIVCGAPGRDCASRRVHAVPELQKAVLNLLQNHFRKTPDDYTVGTWAALSLLDEVSVTPKPGLVDRANTGSHSDMDLSTFVSSTAALVPYFRECAKIGCETWRDEPEETFRRLRQAGMKAEQAMLRATGGVNTHKGAVFTLGILCGAAGRLRSLEGEWTVDALFETAAAMTRTAMASDFRHMTGATAGGRLYHRFGIRGIRGEAADGFPSIRSIGLPVFAQCLNSGMDRNKAGAVTLLHLIARVEDTNMIARGGMELAAEARAKAAALLPEPTEAELAALDRWFTERNLSPGGCADLLAAVCFVHRLITH